MAGEKGELAKTIMLPYLQRADELQKHDPLVAYYCRLYAMERGMKVPSKERSKTMNALLISLMNQLEKDKKTVKLNPDDNLHVEGFALNVFSKADKQDRAGRADLNTAKTFYAASIFFEILNQFGELQPEVEQKQKYAVWKAADIRKALSEGRTPEPGPPGGDSGFSLDDVLTEDELLQERGNSAPAPQNTSPSFQDHQQNSYSPPSFQEHGTTGSFTSRIDHLRAAPDGAGSRPDDMDYQQQPEQRAHHSKFSGDQHFQPEYRAHHPDFSSFPPPTEQHFQATNSDRWGGETNEDYGSVAAAPFASATYPQAASSAYYPTPSSLAGDYHTPPSDQHAPPSYPCFNNAPGSLQPPPQQQHQFPSAPIYGQDQAQIPRTSSAPPAAKQESDSSYSPTPDKVSEAHRASRFAVSALAFDDVPTAISYLRRALELLTSPSAS